jgi:hypothetical protein
MKMSATPTWFKRLCSLMMLCMSLLAMPSPWAQTATPMPQPALNLFTDGKVEIAVAAPDGSLYFAGDFRVVNGQPRTKLAKLLPDGMLDPDWIVPTFQGLVISALALDASGNLIVAGGFTLDGESASVVKLDAESAQMVEAWQPVDAVGGVSELVVDAGQHVYIAGNFSSVNGVQRSRIAKLDATTGALILEWDAQHNADVHAMALDGQGALFVGGYPSSGSGQPQNSMKKFSTSGSGSVDALWTPMNFSLVRSISSDGAGALFVCGEFNTSPTTRIIKLSASGSGAVDGLWSPDANWMSGANRLALDGNGGLLVNAAAHLRRVMAGGSGATDPSWNIPVNGLINAIVVNADDEVAILGDFNSAGGMLARSLAVFDDNAQFVGSATIERPGDIHVLAAQPAGGMIVGGKFHREGAHVRHNILRLQSDGSLDTAWDSAINGQVHALAVDGAGDVFIGGFYTSADGMPRLGLAKADAGDGHIDPLWNPISAISGTIGGASALLVDGGTLYVGFPDTSEFGGVERTLAARVSTTGTGALDPNWRASPELIFGMVSDMALDDNGDLYVSGDFFDLGPQANLYKFSQSLMGATDSAWRHRINPRRPEALLIDQAQDMLYAGGDFNFADNVPIPGVARFTVAGAGAVDPTWQPTLSQESGTGMAFDGRGSLFFSNPYFQTTTGFHYSGLAKVSLSDSDQYDPFWSIPASGRVHAIAIDSQGNTYVAGDFDSIGGVPRTGLAAFDVMFGSGFE